MDKIWDRNPSKSEVIGRCGGDEKNKRPRRTDKSRTLKNNQKPKTTLYIYGRLVYITSQQKGIYYKIYTY